MPNSESWQVSDAPLTRLPELAPVALAAASQQRAGIVLAVLEDLVRQDSRANLFLSEVTCAGTTVAAVVAARTASDSASLLAIGAAATSELTAADRRSQSSMLDRLLRHMHRRLAAAGVVFIQAMREPEADPEELTRCGYTPLATLDYLLATRRKSHEPGDQRLAPSSWRFVPFEDYYGSDRPREQLVRLVEATYAGSLDCPKIGELRSAAAVIDSYCQSSAHDPQGWQILVDADDRELGCLLTTPYRQSSSLEVTYMGLVPEARRKGYAPALIERSWKIADAYGLIQLTVAVDRQNFPARGLYRRHGFDVLMSEAVWGRAIALDADSKEGRDTAVARGVSER